MESDRNDGEVICDSGENSHYLTDKEGNSHNTDLESGTTYLNDEVTVTPVEAVRREVSPAK
jgi:hypothetical protein